MTCIYEGQVRTLDCPMCFGKGAVFHESKVMYYGDAIKCPQCDNTGKLTTPHANTCDPIIRTEYSIESGKFELCEWCFDIKVDGICKNDNTKIIDTILSEQKFTQKEAQQMYTVLKDVLDTEGHINPAGYTIDANDLRGCNYCRQGWTHKGDERHYEDCVIYKAQQLIKAIDDWTQS